MLENSKMKVRSAALLSELKGYVASGNSFKAKPGETDDLISSVLLILRMMVVLRDWDPRVYETFTMAEHEDDYEAPMPIFVSRSY